MVGGRATWSRPASSTAGRRPGCWAAASPASGSGSSAWAGSARPWPAAPRAFGLQIHYHNRKPVAARIGEELEATYWDSLDQMLARMDIISVHCPHTPATYHLLSARRLKLLQPHAIVVNTARGEIIDEKALADLLGQGKIAGAGLDVFELEPAINPKLLKLPQRRAAAAHGLGHRRGPRRHGREGDHQHQTWMDGHRPPDRVLPAMML